MYRVLCDEVYAGWGEAWYAKVAMRSAGEIVVSPVLRLHSVGFKYVSDGLRKAKGNLRYDTAQEKADTTVSSNGNRGAKNHAYAAHANFTQTRSARGIDQVEMCSDTIKYLTLNNGQSDNPSMLAIAGALDELESSIFKQSRFTTDA